MRFFLIQEKMQWIWHKCSVFFSRSWHWHMIAFALCCIIIFRHHMYSTLQSLLGLFYILYVA